MKIFSQTFKSLNLSLVNFLPKFRFSSLNSSDYFNHTHSIYRNSNDYINLLANSNYISGIELIKEIHPGNKEMKQEAKFLEMLRSSTNPYDMILCANYILLKDTHLEELVNYIENNAKLSNPKVSIPLIKLILKKLDSKLTIKHKIILLHVLIVHLCHYDYDSLVQLEKIFIQESNIIDSQDFKYIISAFNLVKWKTKDEEYCKFISTYLMNNIYCLNYYNYSRAIEHYSNLEYNYDYTWKFLEYDMISRFKTLYSPRTIRILTVSIFEKCRFPLDAIKSQLVNYLNTHGMTFFTKEKLRAAASLYKNNLLTEPNRKVYKGIHMNKNYETIELGYFLESEYIFSNCKWDHLSVTKANRLLLNAFTKNSFYDEFLKDLGTVLKYKDLAKKIQWEKIPDKDFSFVLKNLNGFLRDVLSIYHELSEYDDRVAKNFPDLIEARLGGNVTVENYLMICFYFYKYSKEQNEFYTKLKDHFANQILPHVIYKQENFLLGILTIPFHGDLKILSLEDRTYNDAIEERLTIHLRRKYQVKDSPTHSGDHISSYLTCPLLGMIRQVGSFSVEELNKIYFS